MSKESKTNELIRQKDSELDIASENLNESKLKISNLEKQNEDSLNQINKIEK